MAKIPTILEAGRADGKLIKTNSIYDDNQKKFLSDKIKEIDDNHNTLNNKVESLTNIVNNNKSNIETKLVQEKLRASTVENNLRETINNITEVNENATSANIVTVDTIPNTSSSNVQQALNELFKNALFAGIATPTTNPGTPDGPVFYIATEGTYANFSNLVIDVGQIGVLKWNGGWSKQTMEIGAGDGNMILEWNTDYNNTRLQVLSKYRKQGLQISYKHPTKGWINEQSIIESPAQVNDNRYWGLDKNWQRILVKGDYGQLNQQDKGYLYAQNNQIVATIKLATIISSDGTIVSATNSLQKIHIFDVENCEKIFLNVEANNFYAPFYAFAFSETSVDDIKAGTETLTEERPELTPANTDFSFSDFITKPQNAKTLIVQETNGKAGTIKVYYLLKEDVLKIKEQVSSLLSTSEEITNILFWKEQMFMYNPNFSYTGENYKYSVHSHSIQYDRIKAELPEGYNIKVRGSGATNTLINKNESGEYVLRSGNTYVEICVYLTDTSQTLTVEKMIADGVKVYGVPNYKTENINYNALQRRNLPYTWMGYRSYTIKDGVITAINNKNFCCLFGVEVKEGRYYRIKYIGNGCVYDNWASYAFFDADYKSNLTALEYDSISKSRSIQSDIVKKAPQGSKYLMFCVQTTGIYNMIFNNVDVTIEEYTESQGLIDITSEQSVSMSMYNAGASEVPSKTKDVGIIVAGQSNAAGRCLKADIPEGIVDENMQIPFCNLKGVLSKNGKPDDNTPFDGIYTLQNVWAFDAIVFKKLSDKLQKNFYVAKYAIGATAIIDNGGALPCWQPDIFKITTPGKESLILKLRETINAVLSAHPNTEFKAVLWHQGEADGTSVQGAFEYYNNFKALIWYIRGLVKNPNLPFIFGTISHKSFEYSAIVEDAQKRIAAEDSNVYYVDMSEGELLDKYHFNATWANYLGEEMWKILEPLIDASTE